MNKQKPTEGTTLTITAEIISNLDDGFIIKLYNDETDEAISVNSVDEYANYIIDSVNASKSENFIAQWVPSPNARREDIDLIGMKLSALQKRFDEEIGTNPLT